MRKMEDDDAEEDEEQKEHVTEHQELHLSTEA
jgi:adenylate kinase